MSNRSSRFVHPLQTLTSALAGGPRRLPALAAVLALLVLALLPTTGQAQSADPNEPPLSATLNPKQQGSLLGCTLQTDDNDNLCSARLSDHTFSYDNTDYQITELYVQSDGSLVLETLPSPTDGTVADLALTIGDHDPFELSTATLTGATGSGTFTWANSGLSLTAGVDVPVSIARKEESPAPTVSGIEFTSDPGGDDTYAIGNTVQATVTFSGTVTVTGTPRLELDVGGTAKQADYSSGTGSADLVFSYTVAENDEDTDGVAIGANKLTRNGGTIKGGDGAGPDATLTHDALDADDGHKVDGVRPTFASAETSADGSTFSVTFSEPIQQSESGILTVLENGSFSPSHSIYSSVTATDKTVVFKPNLALAHGSTYTLQMGADVVRDAAGNQNEDTGTEQHAMTNNVQMAQTVSSIVFTPQPGDDDTYAIGDTIQATVTFSDTVTVTDTPQLELNVGGTAKQADYAGGSGSAALVFRYIVAENDQDTDGVAIGADKLTLNDATIKGGDGTGPDATLTHDALDADAAHKVDGVRPTFVSAETSADGSTFSITFSEPLQQSVDALQISVQENGTYSSSHSSYSSVTVTDKTVELKPNKALAHGSTYTFTLDDETVWDAAGNANASTVPTQHPIANNVPMDGSLVGTKPSTPAPPWVRALDGSTSALDVRWAEIQGQGVGSYDLRYRKDGGGDWENGPQDVAETRDEITGLESGTSYEVQVRATNSRGDSEWSPSTSASTGTRYDVDAIYVYWTQMLGSEEPHEDVAQSNGLDQGNTLVNACDGAQTFRAFWDQPMASRNANEWEARIETEGGAEKDQVQRTIEIDNSKAELTGSVTLGGFSIVAISVRGLYGDDWGAWSRIANLICAPPGSISIGGA